MKISFRKLAIAAAVSTVVAPATSIAQLENAIIEEVVVTSTKRASTLQDIPIAVTVTSAETVEQAQIRDIKDLQSVVPTLRVTQNQSSANTTFTIRGFGNGGNNPGIEPSVGVFIDGVYRSRAASSIADFPNLERVEVLSGPQSTLFGKNASAGVISVVTRKPSGESTGTVSASLGNYGSLVLKGFYEGAFSDSAAFSIAATHNESDGYFRNNITGSDLNDRDRQAFRGQLLLNPNDTTEIRFIADYDQIDESCCGVVNILAGPTVPALQFAGGGIVANQPDALNYNANIDPINEIENAGLSMQIDKEYDVFTLTSITSFRTTDSFETYDGDFSGADIFYNPVTTDYETFTQEVRLTSNSGDRLDWMVGGYYFDESIENTNDLQFNAGFRPYVNALTAPGVPPSLINQLNGINQLEAALGLPVGTTFYQAGSGSGVATGLDNEAISLFGQLDFNINDRLTATVGFNYTKDEKEATLSNRQINAFSILELDQIGAAGVFRQITGLAPTPQNFAAVPQAAAIAQAIGATDCAADGSNANACNPLLGLRQLQFAPPISQLPNSIEDNKTDDDDFSYNLRLAYDLTDSINVYAGLSTGFKASSYNLSRDSRPNGADIAAVQASPFGVPNQVAGTRFAGPEESEVIEIGLKARFDRGTFNLAIFDQQIDGFQSNLFTGTGFNVTNAGSQSVKGAEFDLTYYPTDALELKLAGTLLDGKYDEFESAGLDLFTGQTFSLTGTKVGNISDTSLSAAVNYRFNIGNNDAFIRADYFFEDETPLGDNLVQNPVQNIGQFTRETKNLNLAAGLTTESGLGFTLWVRNATDHETITTAFPSVAQNLTFSGYRNPPRTYGVTITKDF